MKTLRTLCIALLFLLRTIPLFSQSPLGLFTQSADVGPVLHKGNTVYNAQTGEYRLSGSGANIRFKKDEFHYAYKKLTGNFILQTRGKLVGAGVDAQSRRWMCSAGRGRWCFPRPIPCRRPIGRPTAKA